MGNSTASMPLGQRENFSLTERPQLGGVVALFVFSSRFTQIVLDGATCLTKHFVSTFLQECFPAAR